MTKEAMTLALEALTATMSTHGFREYIEETKDKAIKALEEALAKQEQGETVGWPCLIAEADFSKDTVTLAMQCTDYKVSSDKHWLCTTPQPAQKPWVALTLEERNVISRHHAYVDNIIKATEDKLKEKNT